MKTSFLAILVCVLTACSTYHLKTVSSTPIKDHGLAIKLNVMGGPGNIAEQLAKHLQSGLSSKGFTLVDDVTATQLNVTVSEFSAGKAALRMLIGFGAGRASLVYNAKFSKEGETFIDYDGAERFTGGEVLDESKFKPLRFFAGGDAATQILLEEATKHIVGLAVKSP